MTSIKADVVAAIMTQPSLKAGLREWGDKAHEAATSDEVAAFQNVQASIGLN
jgi:uncharacterized protein (DUF169 family)